MTRWQRTAIKNLYRDTRTGIHWWRQQIDGVTHEKSTKQKTIGKAKTALERLRQEANGRPLVRATFREAFDVALKIKEGKAKKTLVEAISQDKRLRPWFLDHCPYLVVFERNYETLWEDYKRHAYALNEKNLGRRGSLEHDRKHLLYVLARANTKGWIQRRFQKDMLPLEAREVDHGRHLSDDEVRRLLELVGDHPATRLQVMMAATMGMRRKEILGLRLDEIDFKAQEIRLKASRLKTRRPRKLPIPIAAPVSSELFKQAQEAQMAGGKYVFPYRTSEGVDYDKHQVELSYAWDRASEKVRCTFKDLRATCATNLVAAGIPIPAIAKILGHSVRMLSEIYDRVHADVRAEFRGAFDGRF